MSPITNLILNIVKNLFKDVQVAKWNFAYYLLKISIVERAITEPKVQDLCRTIAPQKPPRKPS